MLRKLKKRIVNWLKKNRLKDKQETSPSSISWQPFVSRERTVLDAKKELEQILKSPQPQPIGACEWGYDPHSHIVEFVVNKKKRQVKASMRFKNNKEILAKSTAKCSTNDVFNIHIGKIIALYRLFNGEIPFKYLNSENPHVPMVGNVVQHEVTNNNFLLTKPIQDFYHLITVKVLKDNTWNKNKFADMEILIRPDLLKIIDDSNDGDFQAYK